MRQGTLCFLIKDNQVLLAMKKRSFGEGKWNGVGGKINVGESLEEACIRETEEEIQVKIKPQDLMEAGRLIFHSAYKTELNWQVRVFLAKVWEGEPTETEEMRPEWFKISEIPFSNMWPDDKYWLPKVLTGRKVEGEFYFNTDGTDFEKVDLKEI